MAVNPPTDPNRVIAHLHDTKPERLGAVALALKNAGDRCKVTPAKRGWERDNDHPGQGSYNERGLIRWINSLDESSDKDCKALLARMLAIVAYRKVPV